MAKSWTPRKKTVELAQQPLPGSRIRRAPPPVDKPLGPARWANWHSREREMLVVITGIMLFALALEGIALGMGIITK